MSFLVKTILSAGIISLSTTIAKKNPSIGGLILALPIVSIIAFAILGYEGADSKILNAYARSIIIIVPLSLIFFVPFAIPSLNATNFLIRFLIGIISLSSILILLMKFKLLD